MRTDRIARSRMTMGQGAHHVGVSLRQPPISPSRLGHRAHRHYRLAPW